MLHKVIIVDSPFEPEIEACTVCDALAERFVDWTFSIRKIDEGWIVECEGKRPTNKNVIALQLDLTGIENYANGFCDAIALALRG